MVKTKIPVGQVQKQSQKVIVNIQERKVKRKRRVRRIQRDGKKSGVSQFTPAQYIAPPIVIAPSIPYQPQPQPILRDTTYDNVKNGIGVLTAKEPTDEEMRKARIEKFNAPSLSDSFTYSEISSQTDNTPMLSTLSSKTNGSIMSRSSESIKSMPYRKLYDEVSLGSVQQNPFFTPSLPQKTPLLSERVYEQPFASAQNVPLESLLSDRLNLERRTRELQTKEARDVRTALQRSEGAGSDVPLETLLLGKFNLEGDRRRAVPTIEQKQRLEQAGQPYTPKKRQVGKKPPFIV